ncbi:endoplasmic reticulum protein [Coprinopsis cinerea AmutBmut pab1-1]|nr:endoplasmic reticulum protein [Coprinopsis cinerea AmutBmut pab1-1]
MPVSTASAAVHIAPVVLKTFIDHPKQRKKREKEGKEAPQDDILFHQAFNIVKAFIDLGTKNTVESLQAFTNTHIPSPYWAATVPVTIPLTTCNEAADVLIDWFGPDDLKHVVGGERWWQVRGLDGVDGEWIAEREHFDEKADVAKGRKIGRSEEDILRMEQLESVMLYVHGGGYFWGSINTHRFQILRYARKFRGRAFAVNYRKAPQYPWPCPVQDVLAAYFYLIRPPPGAVHSPVSPNKIVLAGDSAGGGLCLSLLTILRDMELPMPAGAVLISPWVDLTHSFPSVMQNTETDIIPPHGFLAKPSALWPVDPNAGNGPRIVRSETNPPPKPGHADTLKPTEGREKIMEETRDIPQGGYPVETQEEMLDKYPDKANPEVHEVEDAWSKPHSPEDDEIEEVPSATVDEGCREELENDPEGWEPKPPKVLMENSSEVPLELRSQIQVYALTEQLTHPLVSPILQGSLGNLPPLYIIAGDGEVLRDEIIYLAHRAAHPSEFPARKGLVRDSQRQKENVKNFTKPTKVHLQVFDGMCHVLTVFMFASSTRYAYRSIAEFVKHVTQNESAYIDRVPFPEFHWSPDGVKGPQKGDSRERERDEKDAAGLFQQNEELAGNAAISSKPSVERDLNRHETPSKAGGEIEQGGIPDVFMVCERVDIHARVRHMEPRDEIPCLKIPPSQIGVIKEAPAMRWYRGQEKWDKRFKATASRVVAKRVKLKAKSERILRNALDQGLVHPAFPETIPIPELGDEKTGGSTLARQNSIGAVQEHRRWGPLDLGEERPPPSAIAGRRDTPEALALLRKCIYHTAPVTHQTVPRLKKSDVLRAAFDPHDDPNAPPKQSVSEEQVQPTPATAMHGLRMWDKILTYLGRKSAAKASDGIKSTVDTVQRVSGVSNSRETPSPEELNAK